MALGGKRPGAGRKKGSVTKKTLDRRKAEEALHGRILSAVDRIFNAQLALAEGTTYLYRIEQHKNGKQEHILVTDPETIKQVLDDTEGAGGTVNDEYYYITTKSPDNRALDSMLDRVFGKATQKTELTGKDGKELPTPILINMNVPSDVSHQKDSSAQ